MWIVVPLNRNRECWHLLPLSKKEEGGVSWGLGVLLRVVYLFVCVKNGNISSKLLRDKECILLHLILIDQIISPLNVS